MKDEVAPRRFKRVDTLVGLFAGLAGVGLVGLIDSSTGPEIGVSIFYVLPIALTVWFAGPGIGLALSVLAAVVWFRIEVTTGTVYSHALIPYWNAAVRLGFFVLVTLLLGRVRFLTRHMGAMVREQTASLGVEVELRRQAEAGLREREERFRQVVENIREVFWMSNPEKNQMLYVSPAYEEIWGRSCASLLASPQDWVTAIAPDDRERVLKAALTKQAGGEYREIYRITRPDGAMRWIEDRAFPVRDESGQVYRIVGVAEDITERKRTAERTTALSLLGRQLSGALTPSEAALIILRIADDLLGWDAAYLHLWQSETRQLIPILTMDTVDGQRVEIPADTFTWDPSTWMEDVMRRGSRLVNREQPAFAPVGPVTLTPFGDKSRPSASMLYVVIQHGSRTEGILSIQSYTVHAYDEEDLVVLQSLADYCAVALERIRMESAVHQHQQDNDRLAAEVLAISDRERRRMGHDLHDGLGQLLSATALKAKVLEEILMDESSSQAPAAAQIVRLINQANGDARALARGLDPVEAEAGRLEAALRLLAADAEALFSGTCRLQAPETALALSSSANAQLYRITQEAISNAFKHGYARCVEIELSALPDQICLTIRDDGKGFVPKRASGRGMGLQIMRYRAESIGGTLEVLSRPDGGTEVRCDVPNATPPQQPAKDPTEKEYPDENHIHRESTHPGGR